MSIAEIVAREYSLAEFVDSKFHVPQILADGRFATPSVAQFIGQALDEMVASPREAFPIMDGLRLFHDQWNHKVPIELVALLPMLVNMVRGQPIFSKPTSRGELKLLGPPSRYDEKPTLVDILEAAEAFRALAHTPLPRIINDDSQGSFGYAIDRFRAEYNIQFANRHIQGKEPMSIVSSYADVVRLLERFTDDVAGRYLADHERTR